MNQKPGISGGGTTEEGVALFTTFTCGEALGRVLLPHYMIKLRTYGESSTREAVSDLRDLTLYSKATENH